MSYFFPGLIRNIHEFRATQPAQEFSVSSGEHAIRILLKASNLAYGSKVALPAFVCTSVARAVTDEGFVPFYLDLENDGTFSTAYTTEILSKEKPAAIILVHLYGVLHTQNQHIENYCLKNNIFLIQDLAQSFGLNERLLNTSFPIIYSFGPGKSSTAASGAVIRWKQDKLSKFNLPAPGFINTLKARLLLVSRIYGHNKTSAEQLLQKVLDKFFGHDDRITKMSRFQLKAAGFVMHKQSQVADERKKRWALLNEACKNHLYLKSAMPDADSLGFKYVINAQENADLFGAYLDAQHIPYYCLGKDIASAQLNELPNFKKYAPAIFEISCEAVIPIEEIKRIAKALTEFKK